jgi:adhesin transport system outer membrane protein
MLAGASAQGASLKEAVMQAINTNPALRAIGDNRTAIGHEVRRAQGEFLPQLDVFAGYGFQKFSSPATRAATDDDNYLDREEYSAIVTQRIFDGFSTSSEVQRQRARVRSAAHRVFENAEVLALDTALSYLEVLRQRRLLELSRENVQVHESILGSLKERQEAGGGSVSDVAQTEARLARAQATLLTTENELRDAEASYKRIVGDAPEDLVMPDFDYTLLPNDEEQAVAMAEKGSPTVRIFDADVDVASKQIDVADAAFYPSLRLEASYNYTNDADGVPSWSEDVQLMLRMNWNLYRGGTDAANRRVAIARQAQAKSQRWAASINAVEEMRRSWSAYTIESERGETLTTAVEFSEQTRDLYRQQFDVAQRTLLDVLDAENELFVARGQKVSADVNRQAAGYRILATVGSLLGNLGVAAPKASDPKTKSLREAMFD